MCGSHGIEGVWVMTGDELCKEQSKTACSIEQRRSTHTRHPLLLVVGLSWKFGRCIADY